MLLVQGDDESVLLDLLDRCLVDARARVALPHRTVVLGRGAAPSDDVDFVIEVRDPRFCQRVLAEGNLGLAESFMDGGWSVTKGSMEGFLTALVRGRADVESRLGLRTVARMAALRVAQLARGTQANVQAHYDVGEDLYGAFLDATRGYTCGYQKTPEDTIEQLQENKYDRICQKLRLREGETFFDVGCGFGGLVIHAAQRYGVRARGITNSRDHGAFAAKRVRELGLEGRVTVEYGDFREARGRYDKVASAGLFEHLYPHEHRAFFGVMDRLLAHDGYGLVHTLGCVTATNDHDPFIQKYIFPGSTQNPLSVIAGGLERAKLAILDVENIGRHYVPTTVAWLDRYRKNRHTLDSRRYDARFQRMWEYYLAVCVAGATASDGAIWQVLFTREYRRIHPMHRV